ncbi:hypothetical protein [Neisseria meningitidis]|nr:hypothetical protein [Neisseria meningitidis]
MFERCRYGSMECPDLNLPHNKARGLKMPSETFFQTAFLVAEDCY